MKKTIRVFSVIALVVAVLGAVLLTGYICLQKVMLPVMLSAEEVLGYFYFPAGAVIYALGILLAAILMAVGINMGGIAMEIIAPILVVVTPMLQTVASMAQTTMVGQMRGVTYLAGISAMYNLCNMPLTIGRMAAIMLTLVCGMSIAYKKMK